MAANKFESGHDVIEVYGIEEGDELVSCVDVNEGFLFMMEPAELASFLTDHGYTFTGAA